MFLHIPRACDMTKLYCDFLRRGYSTSIDLHFLTMKTWTEGSLTIGWKNVLPKSISLFVMVILHLRGGLHLTWEEERDTCLVNRSWDSYPGNQGFPTTQDGLEGMGYRDRHPEQHKVRNQRGLVSVGGPPSSTPT